MKEDEELINKSRLTDISNNETPVRESEVEKTFDPSMYASIVEMLFSA
jgi:hypothetical protein